MDERELRQDICTIGRRMHDRGLVAAWDGNISARLPDGRFLCTPTMVSKGLLKPDQLCVVDQSGKQLAGEQPRTSEVLLHLVIYRERPDVHAVVHAHPPHACAFAMTGTPIPNGILAEVEVFLGVVPTVGYTLPGTSAFAESVVPHLDRTNTVLLANHGSVAFGPTLDLAYGQTEILDAYCRTLILARSLGPPKALTPDQIGELLALKKRMGYLDPRNHLL
jgi:L-fuculose-phosphate aldolase